MTRRNWKLLLALVVPALLLSGCGLLSSGESSSPGAAGDAGASAGDGDTWLVSALGSPTPAPKPSSGARPAATPTSGFLSLTGGGRPNGTPTPICSPNMFNFSRIAGLDVTPGTTSAALSWYNVGGDNLVEFRLYAISQDLVVGSQRDIGYVVVKPKTPCGQMSATIGNLSPKTHYVFSVDAVVVRRSGDGTHSATVFRSGSIPTR